MFSIYINDIFLFRDNGCLSNYADDATLYLIGENHNTNRNILNKNFLSLQISLSLLLHAFKPS